MSKQPHKAVLLIRVEMHELDKNGQCIKQVNANELTTNGISPKAVYSIEGFDKYECIKKLKAVLDGLRKTN